MKYPLKYFKVWCCTFKKYPWKTFRYTLFKKKRIFSLSMYEILVLGFMSYMLIKNKITWETIFSSSVGDFILIVLPFIAVMFVGALFDKN